VKTFWRGKFFAAILLRTARFARFFIKKIKLRFSIQRIFALRFFELCEGFIRIKFLSKQTVHSPR